MASLHRRRPEEPGRIRKPRDYKLVSGKPVAVQKDVMSDLNSVVAALREFAAERDWRQFHDPKNLAMALSSEVGELCALYRWVRTEDADTFSQDPKNRPRIEDELADVTIFLLLLADRTGIDLEEVALKKIAQNAARYPVEKSRGVSERPEPG